ncbi:unnamed protein product [Rotaria sp. Silwood1]|nr:unnamed protein product [Rotaria sp. Silwood1]
MIGLVQVIAEAVLVAFGLTQIGNALISGTFSWKEWAIQKAISFGLSMLTAGIGKFLTDKIMEQIQENVIQKIVSKIEENLLKGIIGLINNKVATLYLQKKTLGKDILLPQQFDNIRTRVVSSLRNSYHLFADGLKKSNSKYVKIAATTLKAIDIINKNPKQITASYLREAKDKDRALGLADIKMLADRKRRKITVYNSDTDEKEIINPSGVRKIPALFKQSAKIYYEVDENGDIGHYFTGRETETYIQINGRKDCLLIAYHESLGSQNGSVPLVNIKEKKQLSDVISNRDIEKEIKYKLIPEAMKKLRNENDKLVVITSQPFKAGTIKQTDNVRLDDQNFTGNSDYVNFQVQIDGQRYKHQHRGNEFTTVAHILVTRPPKDSDAVYHYSSREIAKVLLHSLNNGKTVKLLAENL